LYVVFSQNSLSAIHYINIISFTIIGKKSILVLTPIPASTRRIGTLSTTTPTATNTKRRCIDSRYLQSANLHYEEREREKTHQFNINNILIN
jgi:hypothetical protein